jgi:lipoyl synthase
MINTIIQRPLWLKKRLVVNKTYASTREMLVGAGVNTVCESARCPNQNECFSRGEATFLLLGDVCTRACAFCSAKKGIPEPLDPDEPARIVEAAKKLDLRYLVLTSVTRDDLGDGGAGQFADVVRALRVSLKDLKVEVLIPDFKGDAAAIKKVVEAKPDVFAHNLETVKRLYVKARSGADYSRSLDILRITKKYSPRLLTKSSIMVGLGEEDKEFFAAMADLRDAQCDILTIGQYLRARKENMPVAKYVTPEEFERYKEAALNLGFKYVASGPFVRSSYRAEEIYCNLNRREQ